MKFMHPFHLCLMVLFAYGLAGLSRRYLETAAVKAAGLGEQMKKWWAGASAFEKLWNYGCGAVIGLSVLAWLVYTSAHREMVAHLGKAGFDADSAGRIASFSAGEVGVFVLILMICAAVLLLVQGGMFSGGKARWAGLLLGLVLVADLARADLPWIKYYDYREKYATNPVVDFLTKHTEQARVVAPGFQINQNYSQFLQFYHVEWIQHHFPYNNIRAMDVAQEPRKPADKDAYERTVGKNLLRYWQLTNTRYLFGVAPGFVEQLNQQLDPVEKRFKQALSFTLGRKPNSQAVEAVVTDNGPFALFEFTGALPRAQLYPGWQTVTNDEAALNRLADPAFNPAQTVLVAEALPASTNLTAAIPVDASTYEPRAITFKTSAAVPTVLLLNERYDPRWQVTVDGVVQKTLRCNFIMRGVPVPAGNHQVVFRFQPSLTTCTSARARRLSGCCSAAFFSPRAPAPAPARIQTRNADADEPPGVLLPTERSLRGISCGLGCRVLRQVRRHAATASRRPRARHRLWRWPGRASPAPGGGRRLWSGCLRSEYRQDPGVHGPLLSLRREETSLPRPPLRQRRRAQRPRTRR